MTFNINEKTGRLKFVLVLIALVTPMVTGIILAIIGGNTLISIILPLVLPIAIIAIAIYEYISYGTALERYAFFIIPRIANNGDVVIFKKTKVTYAMFFGDRYLHSYN